MKATDKASKSARTPPRDLPSNDPTEAPLGDALLGGPLGGVEATLDGARLVAPALADDASDSGDAIEEIDVTDAIDLTEITDLADTELALAENAASAEGYEAIEPGDPSQPGGDASETPGDGELLMGADASSEERPSRKRLEEQLEALKRKETELRRALVIADHPELADAIRALQGRAYAIGRVETKLALGLSKSEERRRETLDKKLGALRTKREELDTQIGALEGELNALGQERTAAFEVERKQALEQLLIALGTHEPTLRAAGIDASTLVPELNQWLPEIEGLAERLVAERSELAAVSEVATPASSTPGNPTNGAAEVEP